MALYLASRTFPVGCRRAWIGFYQVMEKENRAILDEWIANWSDIVDFEVHPVMVEGGGSEDRAASVK
jgi:hypothetical protein